MAQPVRQGGAQLRDLRRDSRLQNKTNKPWYKAFFKHKAKQTLKRVGNDTDGISFQKPRKNWGLAPSRSDQSVYWSAFAHYFYYGHERRLRLAHVFYENFKEDNEDAEGRSDTSLQAAGG